MLVEPRPEVGAERDALIWDGQCLIPRGTELPQAITDVPFRQARDVLPSASTIGPVPSSS